jgi:hypothetical protein
MRARMISSILIASCPDTGLSGLNFLPGERLAKL